MSFILDALKKSETERQRASGPALFEVKVAAPQSRLPAWAVIVGALLAINLLILLWVLLRRERPQAEPPVSAAAAAPAVAAATPVAAAVLARPVSAAAAAVDAGEAIEPAVSPNDERPAVLPGSAEAAVAARERARAQREKQEEEAIVSQQMQNTAPPQRREPAVMARTAGLPTREELVNSGRARIPEITLSLHAYDPDPARRFVFLNGSRAREGDAVGGGVVLETITRDGAILSVGGQKFVLTVQ